jgi:FlaA1/EpsC-like NDP-sugar epimerase
VVFHAAAHKHVDVLEVHPEEALATNIMGTANVTDAAMATGVRRFVLISTDKAVRPQSVMGASKWFAEQIARSVDGGCVFCAVRFGNVLGSRGSAIPTFLRQIALGGPVTVTHPDMARYFMSIREAVLLVLQAAALSQGGEVFTLDMGDPVNILELARRLIRLSGRIPERDISIEFIGIRPGEKLVEDVVDPGEESVPSEHPSIIVSRPSRPERASLRQAMRDLAERMKALAASSPAPAPAVVVVP